MLAPAFRSGPGLPLPDTHTPTHAREKSLRNSAPFHVDRSFRAGLEIVNRRITSLPQDSLDALHHQIINLRALIKGNLAQCFVNRCWKV